MKTLCIQGIHKMKTLCIDFDGVIHSYTSGWKGAGNIPDPPVRGAKEFIQMMLSEGFKIVIMSSRASSLEGAMAIDDWLAKHGFPCDKMEVTNSKPAAVLYIDDRGYRFDGKWNDLIEFIKRNRLDPWNKD